MKTISQLKKELDDARTAVFVAYDYAGADSATVRNVANTNYDSASSEYEHARILGGHWGDAADFRNHFVAWDAAKEEYELLKNNKEGKSEMPKKNTPVKNDENTPVNNEVKKYASAIAELEYLLLILEELGTDCSNDEDEAKFKGLEYAVHCLKIAQDRK